MLEISKDLFKYGEFKVKLRPLKRIQKEVIIHYQKQYRFVLNADDTFSPDEGSQINTI